MLRVALGLLASAILLLGSSAIGALGSWALAGGALSLVVGAVVCVIALDVDSYPLARRPRVQ